MSTLQERRNLRLRPGVVAGEERVRGRVLHDDVLEDRADRLDDMSVVRGDGGDQLGHRVALGRREPTRVVVERVGDVDTSLAGKRIAVMRHHVDSALVQDGDDDDVTCGAIAWCSGTSGGANALHKRRHATAS